MPLLQDNKQSSDPNQESYEKTVMSALSVLNESSDQVVDMLTQSEDPATALAEVTALIIGGIDEQSGGQIPEDVILPAAGEILENVGELANQTGVFTVDQALLDKAGDILELELAEMYGADPEDAREIIDNMSEDELNQIKGRFEEDQNGTAG